MKYYIYTLLDWVDIEPNPKVFFYQKFEKLSELVLNPQEITENNRIIRRINYPYAVISDVKNMHKLKIVKVSDDIYENADISTYLYKHLLNSIIKNIICNTPNDTEKTAIIAKMITVILYYYYSLRKRKNESLTRCVICGIEDIISLLIEKENTIYKNIGITDAVIKDLRSKIREENLIDSYKPRGIRIRRMR